MMGSPFFFAIGDRNLKFEIENEPDPIVTRDRGQPGRSGRSRGATGFSSEGVD